MKELLQHPFYMALYGSIFWFIFLWSVAKNRGGNGKKFSNHEWFRHEYDDFLVTLLFAFMLVIWDDEILAFFNDEVADAIDTQHREFARWMYLLPGPITSVLYKIILKLLK